MTPFIRLHPADDVLIARAQLVGGTDVDGVKVRGIIPAGHKVAVRDIAVGEPVRRYNQIIGFASRPIGAGEHVHTQNLDMGPDKGDFERDYAFGQDVKPEPERRRATFMGYKRADGRVATRNDIVIEHDRKLEQLKRFKDDAKDVRAGMECGMKIVGYDDIKEGDILECYKQVEVKRTL